MKYVDNTKQAELFTGEQLSQVGQQMAVDHASAVVEGWGDRAYHMLQDYVNLFGTIPFRADEVRSYAALMDFESPTSNRAWGSIFTRAKNEGIIKSAGTAKTVNPKAHACFCSLWVKS